MRLHKFASLLFMPAAASAIVSCSGSGAGGSSSDGLVHIDWSVPMEERMIDLNDLADVEYIPLETTDESVFTVGTGFGISDSIIAIVDIIGNRSLIFDRSGKYLREINRRGGGSEEYMYMTGALFDMDSCEVCVIGGRRGVYAYDFQGNLKNKTEGLGRDTYLNCFGFCDDDNIVAWDSGELQIEPLDDNKEKYRYVLIDKHTGEVEPIPLAVDHPMGTSQSFRLGDGVTRAVTIGLSPIARSRDGYIISDFASDTLYEYSAGNLKPIAVFENISRDDRQIPDRVSVNFATGRYVSLSYSRILGVTMDDIAMDEKVSGNYLLDRETGEIFKYGMRRPYLKDGEADWDLSCQPVDGEPNTYMFTVTAERLHGNLEDGLLRPEVEAMVEQFDEEANPMVVIVKFKE